MELRFERPRWLVRYEIKLSRVLRFYLAKRESRKGTTFAVYFTVRFRDGREDFPEPIPELTNVPIWLIREWLEAAIRGKRLLKKLGRYYWGDLYEIREAAKAGYQLKFEDPEILAYI
jgi:hypothetical protein